MLVCCGVYMRVRGSTTEALGDQVFRLEGKQLYPLNRLDSSNV